MAKPTSLLPFMVRRYLRFDKEQPFIFLSAFLAYSGIALGVMVLMIAMALMNGMSKEFQKRLFVMNYPLTVVPQFGLHVDQELVDMLEEKLPQLKFSPYIRAETIAKKRGQMEGGLLFGVDFTKELAINSILRKALKAKRPGKFETVIGKTLYENFLLDKNSKLTYIFTDVSPNGFALTPKMKRFKVVGTFDSGLEHYDKAYHYTNIESVRKIKGWSEGSYSGIHIYSKNPMVDIKKVEAILPPNANVIGWWEQNGNFFSALELEKHTLFIVLMLIILIAAINIISSLLMTVMNRRSEIALLLSLGATPLEIKKLFIYIGVIIGLSGVITGLIFGFTGMWALQTFDIISLPKDVYGTSKLPIDLDSGDLIGIIVGAFVIVILSAFYPAKKASDVDPLQVLRNE